MTVATALVASQAVLCGVIGWVTFGGNGSAHSQSRANGALLGPPVVVPPASVAPVVIPPPTRHPAKPDKTPSVPPKPTSARITTTPPASRSRTPDAIMVAPKPPATTAANGDLVKNPTPSPSAVQGDVELGEACDLEGADGVTADDVAVRCLRDKSGDLVWQII